MSFDFTGRWGSGFSPARRVRLGEEPVASGRPQSQQESRQPQSGQRWWACSGRSAAPHIGQSASGASGEYSVPVCSIERTYRSGPRGGGMRGRRLTGPPPVPGGNSGAGGPWRQAGQLTNN